MRTLPRVAQSVARVARRKALPPMQAAKAVRRTLPQTAQRVARNPALARRLAASSAPGPLVRPRSVGRGMPDGGPNARRFTFTGPVTLTISGR